MAFWSDVRRVSAVPLSRVSWSREHHDACEQSSVEGYAPPRASSPVVTDPTASRDDATPWQARVGVSFR